MARRIALFLALAAALPAAAAEREPETLALEGKWVANYDTDSCQLGAQFGTGKDMVIARFTRFEPGDTFNLDIVSDRVRSPEARGDARVDFGLKGAPVRGPITRGSIGTRPAVYFRGLRIDGWEWKAEGDTPPPITPEQEKSVSGVTVMVPGARPFRLVFGHLDKPMAAMRTCLTDLVRSWGYDPAAEAALSERAKPTTSPGKWLNPNDYPDDALRGGHNGMVQFRLDVDASGAVTGCHVLARTNPDDFADITCRQVTRRARFEPALDAAGTPARSFFISRVQWQMSR